MIFLNESVVDSIIMESWTYDDFMYHTTIIDNEIRCIQEGYAQDIITEGFVDTIKAIFNKIGEKVMQFINWVREKLREIKNRIFKKKTKEIQDDGEKKKITIYHIDNKLDDCVDYYTKTVQLLTDIFYMFSDILSSGDVKEITKINEMAGMLDKIKNNAKDQPKMEDILIKEEKEITIKEFIEYQTRLSNILNKYINEFSTVEGKNSKFLKVIKNINSYNFKPEAKELETTMHNFATSATGAVGLSVTYGAACINILQQIVKLIKSIHF